MRTGVLIIALMLAASSAALAQVKRLLPPDAKRGELTGRYAFPLVQIDDKVLRLAPGGVIVDEHNRTLVHAALPAKAPVLFMQDPAGNVTRIILLRPDEVSALDEAAKH